MRLRISGRLEVQRKQVYSRVALLDNQYGLSEVSLVPSNHNHIVAGRHVSYNKAPHRLTKPARYYARSGSIQDQTRRVWTGDCACCVGWKKTSSLN